jgi:hypothetical protein
VAINYKRCPKCGSLNTVKILYGFPTYEAFLLSKEGKIKLGGCCVTGSDPEFFCKDCENEWTKQDAVNHAYNQIRGIKTSVGGNFGGFYNVEINFKSRVLTWSYLGGPENEYYEKIIRKATLNSFIEELKILNLLNWKTKYIDPRVFDGTRWSVEIKRSGKNISIEGLNKYPDKCDDFCKLITKVSGMDFS